MDWWLIALLALVASATVGATAFLAYGRGVDAGERAGRAGVHVGSGSRGRSGSRGGASDDAEASLFGAGASVRDAERGLIEAMPEAAVVRENSGRILYASDTATALGVVAGGRITCDELASIIDGFLEDRVVREREIAIAGPSGVAAAYGDGRGMKAGERADDGVRRVRVRVAPIDDDRYVVFLTDVSDRRRFEAMRRDFATNVSHELKTPVGAIGLLAETIGDAADDPDAVRYFAGRVAKESQRLTELVHRLIDLQKAESLDAATLAPTSALAVARAAIGANRVLADAHGIAIRLTVDGEDAPIDAPIDAPADAPDAPAAPTRDVTVVADADALTMAVRNLVENAIRYSPDHTTVVVALGRRDARATIRVVDQGIGIPADKLDRVFERFYRVDQARSRDTGGSGLGLSIVRHCVEECRGTVSVWSHEGSGSTFTIELDAA